MVTVRGEPVAVLKPFTQDDRDRDIREWLAEGETLAEKIGALWPKGVSAVDAVREQRRW